MKKWIAPLCIVLILSYALATVASVAGSAQTQSPSKRDTSHFTGSSSDPGERVFNANCARCHTAPMTLPPRITGTVILHMRVRARLSRADEQLFLKYLAP